MTNEEIKEVWEECRAAMPRYLVFAHRIAAMQRSIDVGICVGVGARLGTSDAAFDMADSCAAAIREQSDE